MPSAMTGAARKRFSRRWSAITGALDAVARGNSRPAGMGSLIARNGWAAGAGGHSVYWLDQKSRTK